MRTLWLGSFICRYSDSRQCLPSAVGIPQLFQKGCARERRENVLEATSLDVESGAVSMV